MLGGAQIGSATFGLGNAGAVTVRVSGQAVISQTDSQGFASAIDTDSLATGAGGSAGSVHVSAGSLQLLGGAQVQSSTFGAGQGGDVSVRVSHLVTVSGRGPQRVSQIGANSESAAAGGSAGKVQVSAGVLKLMDGGEITSATVGLGNAGEVSVRVSGDATISGEDAQGFSSGVFGNSMSTTSGGSGGNIHFSAASLQISGGGSIASQTDGLGNAGDLAVRVSGKATIDGADATGSVSRVSTDTTADGSSGSAGDIRFSAGKLDLLSGGTISSSTSGSGKGGKILVKAFGNTTISGADAQNSNAGIFAETLPGGSGSAGSIQLNTGRLQILEGAEISSSTAGTGVGGNINVNVAGAALFSGPIGQSVFPGLFAATLGAMPDAGRGGNITLRAGVLRLGNDGELSASSAGPATAGSVSVYAGNLTLINGGLIDSDNLGSGDGGNVIVDAGRGVRVSNLSGISTLAEAGNGGDIFISSGDSIVIDNSGIITNSALNGGSIHISAPAKVFLRNGAGIGTNSGGNGGNISIDPVALTLLNGIIQANGGTNGGNISLFADSRSGVITTGPFANVSATGGTGVSGAIVAAPEQLDIAGSLVLLQTPLASSLTLLPQCGVKLGTDQSSFIITGRGGTPTEPGNWQPDLELTPRPSR